jgi:hypothetical protein
MIDSSPSNGQPYFNGAPQRQVNTLATEKIEVDRKIFFLDLQENHRGRFLKITEDVGGRRDTIIVPIEASSEFMEALKRVIAGPVEGMESTEG